jgi:hypothetical protein
VVPGERVCQLSGQARLETASDEKRSEDDTRQGTVREARILGEHRTAEAGSCHLAHSGFLQIATRLWQPELKHRCRLPEVVQSGQHNEPSLGRVRGKAETIGKEAVDTGRQTLEPELLSHCGSIQEVAEKRMVPVLTVLGLAELGPEE